MISKCFYSLWFSSEHVFHFQRQLPSSPKTTATNKMHEIMVLTALDTRHKRTVMMPEKMIHTLAEPCNCLSLLS